MTMINNLTKTQQEQIPVFRDKWLDIGLSTARLDRDKAIEAVKKAYRLAGLKEPTKFHFVRSPIEAINYIQGLDKSISASDIISSAIYGAHDAGWLSFYDYFREVVGIKDCDKLEGLFDLAKNVGWMNVYEDLVVFQEKPIAIHFDDQKRLHSEVGPSVEYADGFGIYSWHGVAIPKEWITKRAELTPKMALGWTNIEQRRAACEIVTWARILRELDAKVIESDADPMIGTLVEVNIPEIGKEKFLKVLCGTGREFAIPVPPNMKTALEANAWTYDLKPEEYMPEVRT